MKNCYENFIDYLIAWKRVTQAWNQEFITRKECEESLADLKLIYGII